VEVPALCLSRAARRTGSCLCAFQTPEAFLGFHHGAAVQRIAMDGERQCLTLRQTLRTVPITFSMMFVQASERRSSRGGRTA